MAVTVADAIAAEYAARLRSFGERASHRFVADVAGLTVVSLGVDEPWGTQIVALPGEPDTGAVDQAVAWCRERGRVPQVVLRDVHRGVLAAYEVDEVLATLVARAGGDQQLLEVTRADDVTEFRGVYADAFGMRTRLAEALVVGADLAALPHLVGKVDGSAVACAQVRPGDSFAYVSGVGVRRDVQRRGYGSAMLAACCAAADRLGCSYVWLNCSPETVPFYEGIGFERVDTYVALIGS